MTATVGVLYTRLRVEEKQLNLALADAGYPALPIPPAEAPFPIFPGPLAAKSTGSSASAGEPSMIVIDRCQNRTVAATVLPLWRATGAVVLDAGLAATGNRLIVATALARAGIPQPETQLVCSEAAALAGLDQIGYPATLLPLVPGADEMILLDRDTAEAVLEHRNVLGAPNDALALLQAGSSLTDNRVSIIVVGGRAVAIARRAGQTLDPAQAIGIAEAAAAAIGASVVGIDIAVTAAGPVVWDCDPVPEFRGAAAIAERSVATAIADLAVGRLNRDDLRRSAAAIRVAERAPVGPTLGREVADDVALTA